MAGISKSSGSGRDLSSGGPFGRDRLLRCFRFVFAFALSRTNTMRINPGEFSAQEKNLR